VFTGIIETLGGVVEVHTHGDLTRLGLEAPAIAAELRVGDSVAVNGVCLTVVAVQGEHVAFEAVRETLARTTLGSLRAGSRVNLERALRADARLDGHIVQGHVDEAGPVRELRRLGEDVLLRIGCSRGFADWLVPKGSVAVDGVALTLVEAGEEGAGLRHAPGQGRAGQRLRRQGADPFYRHGRVVFLGKVQVVGEQGLEPHHLGP